MLHSWLKASPRRFAPRYPDPTAMVESFYTGRRAEAQPNRRAHALTMFGTARSVIRCNPPLLRDALSKLLYITLGSLIPHFL